MWAEPTLGQSQDVVDLIERQGKSDCVLVSSVCGGQVASHTLLLSLHSPLLATFFREHTWWQGVTLPLALPVIRGLVGLLHGKGAVKGVTEQEVKEAADLLAIPWQGLRGTFDENLTNVKLNLDNVKMNLKYVKVNINSGKNKVQTLSVPKEIVNDGHKKTHKVGPMKTKVEPKIKYEEYDDRDDCLDSGPAEVDYKHEFHGEDTKSKHAVIARKLKGKITKLKKKDVKIGKSANKEFPCDECKIGYNSNLFLMKHKLKAHAKDMKCEKCTAEFTDYHQFKKHAMENHPTFTCPVCGISKFNKTSLRNHIESKHENNTPCPHCGVPYTTQASLNLHIERMHSNKEPQKCPKCNFKTLMSHELKGHFIRMHTENTKETCQYCGEVFKYLKKHQIRTGCDGKVVERKKLSCIQCGKKFNWKSFLSKHVKEIHSGVKDRSCSYCSYATYSSFNLKLHITKVHFGTKLSKETCVHCEKSTSNLKYHTRIYHPLLSEIQVE